jgi:lipoprotein NlpI
MILATPVITAVLLVTLLAWAGPNARAQDAAGTPSPAATADKSAAGNSDAEKLRQLNQQLEEQFRSELERLPEPAADAPADTAVDQHSRRGDLQLYLARFADAETSYRRMVELDPSLDASHWRLGIACFFAEHPQAGADQFEKYHSFDSVDRENGIWRYFCHFRASGKDAARKQLLRYDKDDRPPFREVYQLFQGTLSAEQVLKTASAASAATRPQRLFYSHLYVGLNASLEGDRTTAIQSLQQATLNEWPRNSGYGPRYMWHVGRLELNRLNNSSKP